MYTLSQIIGKTAIDKNNGGELGRIDGIGFDKWQKKYAVIIDGKYVSYQKAYVKRTVTLEDTEVIPPLPMLKADTSAYDVAANYLGKTIEYGFSKTLKPTLVTLDNGAVYSSGKIHALGDVLLIKNTVKKRSVKSAEKRTEQKKQQCNQIYPTNGKSRRPNKKYGDFTFLIGKIVDKNITNFQGETMIKRGESVNKDILRQAKISGKLIELCLHAK